MFIIVNDETDKLNQGQHVVIYTRGGNCPRGERIDISPGLPDTREKRFRKLHGMAGT